MDVSASLQKFFMGKIAIIFYFLEDKKRERETKLNLK